MGGRAQGIGIPQHQAAGAGIEGAVRILNAHGHLDGCHVGSVFAQQADHVDGDIGNLAGAVGDLQSLAAVVVNNFQSGSVGICSAVVNGHKAVVAVLEVDAGIHVLYDGGIRFSRSSGIRGIVFSGGSGGVGGFFAAGASRKAQNHGKRQHQG